MFSMYQMLKPPDRADDIKIAMSCGMKVFCRPDVRRSFVIQEQPIGSAAAHYSVTWRVTMWIRCGDLIHSTPLCVSRHRACRFNRRYLIEVDHSW